MTLLGKNQLHGKFFENLVKETFLKGKNDNAKALDAFDIKACTETGNSPVSVKMTKTETVGLADAYRAFQINHDFKMIVGTYIQDGSMKSIRQIYEFNITASEWETIKGNIPIESISNFNQSIKFFPTGKHKEAREYSKKFKKDIHKQYQSYIDLNPKIDSKNQRRLQCSISIYDLKEIVKDWTPYSYYNFGNYRGIMLPLSFRSEKRRLKKKKGVAS